MATTVWHVAGAQYQAGDPLLPWNSLIADGTLTEDDWHWDDAPEGWDGDVVCVYESEAEAREHLGSMGGTLLVITVPDDHDDADPLQYDNPYGGYIRPRSLRVEEGYLAFANGIPCEWIAVAQ